MKLPDSIRVNGVEYQVNYVPNLRKGNMLVYGNIDHDNSCIELSDTDGTEHQKRCIVLWQEILQGICEANSMELENKDAVINMFARGIYQVLQDNEKRLFNTKK